MANNVSIRADKIRRGVPQTPAERERAKAGPATYKVINPRNERVIAKGLSKEDADNQRQNYQDSTGINAQVIPEQTSFTMTEVTLPLCEIGPAGVSRMAAQNYYELQLKLGLSIQDAMRGTEFALNIRNLRTDSTGKNVVAYDDAVINEAADATKKKQAFDSLVYEVKRGMRYPNDEWSIELRPEVFTVDVRHWGQWFTPPDAEDPEDYDWQQPTEATMAKADSICKNIGKRYGVECGFQNQGEKNWMSFFVKK